MTGDAPRRRDPLPWLAPLGWLYLRLAGLHHRLYDLRLRRVHRAPLPVYSIGNLTAGGTGKTPAARWLAGHLDARGRRCAVVSRGYLGKREEEPLVVSVNGEIRASVTEAGDEAIELASDPAIHAVVVGRDRLAAIWAAARLGADSIVLDDGFQHRRLHRDMNLLLVDAVDPWGGGRGLPAGLLREPLRGVGRADLVLLTRADDISAPQDGWVPHGRLPRPIRRVLERLPERRRPPVAAARHVPSALASATGERQPVSRLAGRSVLAVSGLAAPDRFEQSLRELDAQVVAHLAWPDHHAYTPEDGQLIARRLDLSGADMIVTTAKDHARWPAGAPSPTVLMIELHVAAADVVLRHVLRPLKPCLRAMP